MALASRLIDVPVGGGVDERSGKKGGISSKWRSLLNARWPNIGEVEKRLGSFGVGQQIDGSAIAINTSVVDNCRLINAGDHLALVDGYRLCALKGDGNLIDTFTSRGVVSEAVVTRAGIGGDVIGVVCSDVAYASSGTYAGCIIYVWGTGSSTTPTSIAIYNATTGAPVLFRQVTAFNYAPRVIVCNGKVYVLGVSSTNLVCYDVAANASSNLKTDLKYTDSDVFAPYDVVASSTRFYVGYQTTGATNLQLYGFDTSTPPAQVTSAAITDAVSAKAIGLCVTSGDSRLWATWYNDTNVRAVATNLAEPSLATTTAAFTLYTPGGTDSVHATAPARVTSTKAIAVIGLKSTTTPKDGYLVAPCFNTSGGIDRTGANSMTRWCMPISRPFGYADASTTGTVTTAYCWVVAGGAHGGLSATGNWGDQAYGQYSHVLVDLYAGTLQTGPARPVAMSTARTASIAAASSALRNQKLLSSVVSPSTGKYVGTGLKQTTPSTQLQNTAVALTASFVASNRWQPARAGDNVYLSGGLVQIYDGLRVYESGFVYDPGGLGVADSGSGTSLNGTYNYVIVYAWTDAKGNVIRSAPCAPVAITTAHNTTLTLPNLSLTTKQAQPFNYYPYVTVEIYRTINNSSGPYYYVGSSTNFVTLDAAETYTDSATDATIVSNRQLYTGLTGTDISTVPHVCPPSFGALIAANGSLWGIGDDQRTLWVSKPYVDGEIVEWSDSATVQFDEGQKLTALAQLDAVVIAFSRNRIYRVSGYPPTGAIGDGGSLVVDRVSADVGCIEPRSVCTTPEGIVFQAAGGGYYLLDRGLNLTIVFADEIQNTLAANPTVTSAVVHPTGKYILVTAHNGGTTGVRFVFDYRLRQWGIDQVTGGLPRSSARICSSAVVGDVLYWIDRDGYVFRETTMADSFPYLDNAATWVTFQGETQDIKLAGLQGYQRIWLVGLLGTRYTGHDLKIEIATDYSDSFAQSKTFLSAVTDLWSPEQCRLDVVRQLCEAIRVRITDAAPTGGNLTTGQGFALAGLALEVGVHKGMVRLPPAQRS